MQPYVSEAAWQAKPKKPLNNYLLYRKEVHDELRKKHPGYSSTQLTILISHMWTHLEEDKKTKYDTEYKYVKKLYQINYQDWLDKFRLDEEKVKDFIKEKKEMGRRNKRGSKKVTKAKKNDEEDDSEDEKWTQYLKQKNQKQEKPSKQQQEPKEKDNDKEKKADKDKKAEKEKKEGKQ